VVGRSANREGFVHHFAGLHPNLAVEVRTWSSFLEEYDVETPIEEVRKYIGERVQLLFLEESLALSFQDGVAYRKGRRHSTRMIAKAEVVLGDPRLRSSRLHYSKALQYFRRTDSPDYPNVVKEAVCSVEAAGKALFADMKARDLGGLVPKLRGVGDGQIPPALATTFTGLYGYRNSGEGVAHGAATGGKVSSATAEYALSVAAAQVILLVDLEAERTEETPF
jgi:hypothetical protein